MGRSLWGTCGRRPAPLHPDKSPEDRGDTPPPWRSSQPDKQLQTDKESRTGPHRANGLQRWPTHHILCRRRLGGDPRRSRSLPWWLKQALAPPLHYPESPGRLPEVWNHSGTHLEEQRTLFNDGHRRQNDMCDELRPTCSPMSWRLGRSEIGRSDRWAVQAPPTGRWSPSHCRLSVRHRKLLTGKFTISIQPLLTGESSQSQSGFGAAEKPIRYPKLLLGLAGQELLRGQTQTFGQ
ncbi:hypothetical protein EYF80_050254 [Liparis tanakae]|uniref:Uncharacterized protein n=1 Tax=Liparis tanakae TaxID=230148 RepID=A0A4Z2FGR9_9TELE|nr:hypothetical protein EYF80_050254 [Liparis tanakae]